ncbi:uncharacterized protein LOC131214881 [Anopheles bellator]|uniref:uncharacterized protein LOC131214881 n=1 Tax=Anopheles bellator TaxID=139047 RepID=UPI002649EA70|nr:uncharacterized protein LOC131214881 [Anopheles bellator]XP_058065201.1 uncharacterized protein LOC131214881 [Anopheles bellator]
MNKMNLTPPFELQKGSSENLQTLNLASHSLHSASDDESELESDTENISLKRLKPATSISLPRTMKVVNYDCPTEPLVCVKQQKVSKLEIHLSGTSVDSSRTPNSEETLKITSGNCAPHSESAPVTDGPRSLDDILQNRIPDEQRALLNVFQNYTPGEPSDKLYIKNLSKHVTEQDLKKIFDLFFEQDVLRVVDVKLMKTGRMKGQAFVSFVSVSADKADELKKIVANVLSVTNGYILKDKPMVINLCKKPNKPMQKVVKAKTNSAFFIEYANVWPMVTLFITKKSIRVKQTIKTTLKKIVKILDKFEFQQHACP